MRARVFVKNESDAWGCACVCVYEGFLYQNYFWEIMRVTDDPRPLY